MVSSAIVVYKPTQECIDLVRPVLKVLKESGIEVYVCSVDDLVAVENGKKYELIISIGGDGTFLKSTQLLVKNWDQIIYPYPCGRRNFYYEKPVAPIDESLRRVLRGEYFIEEIPRYILSHGNGAVYFINDVLVVSTDLGKTGKHEVEISHEMFKSKYLLEGDGVLVSTSYGSAAHNLSAGGPLVLPSLRVLVVKHLNPMYAGFPPLVLPGSSRISIRVLNDHELYADGSFVRILKKREVATIEPSEFGVRVARFSTVRDFVLKALERRHFLAA